MFKHSKVCIFSDLHLGIRQNSTQWHEVALQWALWIKKELDKQGIEDIIFVGDWFDARDLIAVNTIDFASKILEIFKDFNMVFIVGNHDAYLKESAEINSLSILKGWKNIRVIDQMESIEAFGNKITFMPWGVDVEHVPQSDIIFGHLEIESFKLNSHKICDHGITIKRMLEKADLVVSGHFHLREERKFDNGTILYVGNPFQMDFGDASSKKGYYLMDLQTKEYEFYENEISPRHIKLPLSALVKFKTINHQVEKIFKNNIVMLIVDRNLSTDDADKLFYRLGQLGSFQLSVDYDVNFNKFDLEEGEEFDASGIDVSEAINEFISMLDIANKKEVGEYITDLYRKYKGI